jgi:hypothetical protein
MDLLTRIVACMTLRLNMESGIVEFVEFCGLCGLLWTFVDLVDFCGLFWTRKSPQFLEK